MYDLKGIDIDFLVDVRNAICEVETPSIVFREEGGSDHDTTVFMEGKKAAWREIETLLPPSILTKVLDRVTELKVEALLEELNEKEKEIDG